MTLKQRIEAVNALDKERTQGRFLIFKYLMKSIYDGDWYKYNIGSEDEFPIAHCTFPDMPNEANAEFIAKAPEMVQIINEQQKLLNRIATLLNAGAACVEFGTKNSRFAANEHLIEALAEYNKAMEEK